MIRSAALRVSDEERSLKTQLILTPIVSPDGELVRATVLGGFQAMFGEVKTTLPTIFASITAIFGEVQTTSLTMLA
jgi:hypothetical protein